MADVYVNALTTLTGEPASTDSAVMVNRSTNEGKIIDYNLLADKILDKLTSKQYSTLTTTSKLLTGAINELDSDVSSLNGSLAGEDETYVSETVDVETTNTETTLCTKTFSNTGTYLVLCYVQLRNTQNDVNFTVKTSSTSIANLFGTSVQYDVTKSGMYRSMSFMRAVRVNAVGATLSLSVSSSLATSYTGQMYFLRLK